MAVSGTFWTIDELSTAVSLAVSAGFPPQPNGRVREVPDIRTIRYYTTLGLLDRPARWWMRTALYTRRHLQQIVAIKRLQAEGLSLAVIQQRLAGASDALLERVARISAEVEARLPGSTELAGSGDATTERPAGNFWSADPAPVPEEAEAEGSPEPTPPAGLPLQGVRLDDGVTLLVETVRPVSEEDIQAIRTVAAPLLKLLHRRRLLRPRPERTTP
jgi:DNA-binding transcriptional MerR regulator